MNQMRDIILLVTGWMSLMEAHAQMMVVSDSSAQKTYISGSIQSDSLILLNDSWLPQYTRFRLTEENLNSTVNLTSANSETGIIMIEGADQTTVYLPLSSHLSRRAWYVLMSDALATCRDTVQVELGVLSDVIVDTCLLTDGTTLPTPFRIWIVLSCEGGKEKSGFIILNKPNGKVLLNRQIAYLEDISGFNLISAEASESDWLRSVRFSGYDVAGPLSENSEETTKH